MRTACVWACGALCALLIVQSDALGGAVVPARRHGGGSPRDSHAAAGGAWATALVIVCISTVGERLAGHRLSLASVGSPWVLTAALPILTARTLDPRALMAATFL